MISVIIPTYNREKLIERAIRSVLNQTFQDIEVIVVDDASTDQTEQIVKSISCEKLKYVRQPSNGGACRARNRGIKEAKGDYIAFLDSDDEWDPHKLELQLNFLNQKKADIVVCNYFYSKGNRKRVVISEHHDDIITYDELLNANCITTGAILTSKKVLEVVNYFDEELPRYQDWDLVLRIAQKYQIYLLNKPLLTLYFQDQSITNSTSKMKKMKALERILSKNKKGFDYNKKANAHIYWSMGMYSLFSNSPKMNYLRKGIILDQNFWKRITVYLMICFGFKKQIMNMYEKQH